MAAEPPVAAAQPPTLVGRIRSAGWTAWAIIGIAIFVGGFFKYLLNPLSVIFVPLGIALIVVYLLNPLVTVLERRGVRRGLAVLLIYIAFLALVVVVLSLLIPVIARQVSAFIDELPGYTQRVVNEINELLARRGSDYRITVTSEQIFNTISENRGTIVSFLGGVRSVAGQVLHIFITVVIGMMLSVYLLLDLPKIQAGIRKAIPPRRRGEVLEIMEKVGGALGGFFRGQLLVAAFVGVASAIGLTLVKLPFAIVIGLLAGIFNLIPLIGPFLAAVPAVAVALLSDKPIRALYAGIVLLVVQQIDNHLISPNVIGRTVRLHPIVVMLALLAGGTSAGILGMLVVIPAVAAVKIVLEHFWHRREELLGEIVPDPGGT